MKRSRPLRSAGLLVALALAGCGKAEDTGGGALVGATPPSIVADGVVPLGESAEEDWSALAGSVVFLEFGFLH